MTNWKCYTQLAWETLPLRCSCFSGFVVGEPAPAANEPAIEVAYVQGDEATARLITAAPALLAVVEDALRLTNSTQFPQWFLDEAREAIAKATKGAGA